MRDVWGEDGGGGQPRTEVIQVPLRECKREGNSCGDSTAIDVTNFILKMAFATADGERWV